MKTKSQKQQILELLLQGYYLSKLQILDKVKCINAGARILELRQDYYPVRTEMVKNELTGKKFAVYFIHKSDIKKSKALMTSYACIELSKQIIKSHGNKERNKYRKTK